MPLNAKFLGTWELDNTKNQGLDDFGKAMGFTEEQAKLYASLHYSFSISQDDDSYKLDVDFKGKIPDAHYVVKEGETIDYTSADGRKSKLTLIIQDGNPSETYEVVDKNITWVVKRTVEGDTMTCVTTFKEAVMTQVLNRA